MKPLSLHAVPSAEPLSLATAATVAAGGEQPAVAAGGLRPWLRLLVGMGGSAVLFACLLALLVVATASPPAEAGDLDDALPALRSGAAGAAPVDGAAAGASGLHAGGRAH